MCSLRQAKITLYALREDLADNVSYAERLLKSLEQRFILPEQTTLIIPGQEDSISTRLQVSGNRYGYVYVTVFQEANLVARLLIQNYPPSDHVSFDSHGKAVEYFEPLLSEGFVCHCVGELDALSKRESDITGTDIDYKEFDRKNVLSVPELLRVKMEKCE